MTFLKNTYLFPVNMQGAPEDCFTISLKQIWVGQ